MGAEEPRPDGGPTHIGDEVQHLLEGRVEAAARRATGMDLLRVEILEPPRVELLVDGLRDPVQPSLQVSGVTAHDHGGAGAP